MDKTLRKIITYSAGLILSLALCRVTLYLDDVMHKWATKDQADIYLTKLYKVQPNPLMQEYWMRTNYIFWDKDKNSKIDFARVREQVDNKKGVLAPEGMYEVVKYTSGKPKIRYFQTREYSGPEAHSLLEKTISEFNDNRKTFWRFKKHDPFYQPNKEFYWYIPNKTFHKKIIR